MLLLPLADSAGIFGISKIILVLGLGQPGLLVSLLPGLLAVGFGTESLARSTAVIGEKHFVASQALARVGEALHWFPN